MKKVIVIVCCGVLFSSAACAQEKTLHEISEIILTNAEATIQCVAAKNECSEGDVLALKAAAVDDMRDVVLLVTSGNMNRMRLTNDQVVALNARLGALKIQLAQVKLVEWMCNFGVLLVSSAQSSIGLGLFYLPLLYISIPSLAIGLIMFPVGCLVMLSCLFWWL